MTHAERDGDEFDVYSESYDAALDRGLSVSGEGKDYFASGRVSWIARRLDELGVVAPRRILDFGCGTGSATPHLHESFSEAAIVGMDVSQQSVSIATERHGSDLAEFTSEAQELEDGSFDLAYCNGVFHHIPIADRVASAESVFRCLRPGGLFALWDNNPWNPGTHIVMARIPFDHDAVKMSAREGRANLRAAGFEVVDTNYLFVFPSLLSGLRKLEPLLAGAPIGAQYMVLGRRPG